MATLTITAGQPTQVGKSFVVENRPLSGGRDPGREIQLLDPEVSRRHFLIRPDNGQHVICESNSANGVFVNGQSIKQHTLQEGDQIRVGQTVLVYSQQDDPQGPNMVQMQRRAERQYRDAGTLFVPKS